MNPDRVQATNELETFSAALAETNHLVRVSDTRMVLELGNDLWPFPVPIVKKDGKWFFDAQGCCGDVAAQRRFYDRAHALQVLGDGGRLSAWDGEGFELVDRKGREHRYPRSWAR